MDKRNKWTEDEILILKNNYRYGLKKITKMIPNHTLSSIRKKARYLKLKVEKVNIEEIKEVVSQSYSFSDVFRKLNKSKSGDSYRVIKKIIEKNKIDISHFNPYVNNIKNLINSEIPIEEYLKNGTSISSNKLKLKLYKYNLKKRLCEKCGQNEYWNGEKMSLILDHINGISNDNRIENLRILCPNCNATLPTHCKGSKFLND